MARILNDTWRVNVGQGAVMTLQAAGASLSPAIGGAIADALGYRAAFLIFGSFALGSMVLWLMHAALLKPACARPDGDSTSASPRPPSAPDATPAHA